jgi:hypothetical protein
MEAAMYGAIRKALAHDLPDLTVTGKGALPAAFPVAELATCAMGAAAATLRV